MKRVVTKQELDTLVKANDTVRGTHDYMKYFMMMEYKTKQNGKWSAWKYLGHGIPIPADMTVKKVKDAVYLMRSSISSETGEDEMTRLLVTEAVNKVLNIF